MLLDEIEKAHHDVWNVLLQILDDGRLTDGQGRTVNFRNTVIIMTSNVGQEIIAQKGTTDESKKELLAELKRTFRPEFLNRIDDIVIFNPLHKEEVAGILDIELEPIIERLKQRGIKLQITKKAKDFLLEKGYDPQYGARPLKRAVQKYVQDPLASRLLEGDYPEGSCVEVDSDGKRMLLK